MEPYLAGMKAADCPFCRPDRESILESDLCYVLPDKYPVSPGNLLVIPRAHVGDYFELTPEQQSALWRMVEEVKAWLDREHRPDGFNVGFNVGRAAGQTIDHVHLHVIPRYRGDAEDPTGGVRHVIPGKGNYLKDF
ncbi:MAG: HIT family protein [Bacteroidales bacterium]